MIFKLPFNYTFSLTNKCNSRCRTCHIWKKAPVAELTLEEWKKIFLSLGKSPYWVTLSGGEPFLRPDLVEIVKTLCRISKPKMVTIPTNGLLSKKIAVDVKEIVNSCPQTRFIINLSLDGINEKHDQIRGVKGNFKAAMATYETLRKIKAGNLTLGAHTVISKENVKDFPQLTDFVLEQLKPDSYITEIAENRVEFDNLDSFITPKIEDYKKAIAYLNQKSKIKNQKGFARLIQAFRLTYYQLVEKIIESRSQEIPCYAGRASAQIAANGDVWPCCVRANVFGNLRKENYNFGQIWNSDQAKKIRKSIKKKQCWCPLANASYTNILLSPKTVIKVLFNLLK